MLEKRTRWSFSANISDDAVFNQHISRIKNFQVYAYSDEHMTNFLKFNSVDKIDTYRRLARKRDCEMH